MVLMCGVNIAMCNVIPNVYTVDNLRTEHLNSVVILQYYRYVCFTMNVLNYKVNQGAMIYNV